MSGISYAVWSASVADPAFSEWLRSACEPEWTAVVEHRFAEEINRGEVSDDKMRRYLEQDFQFVDSFTALLGAAVASADSFEARVPFSRFVGQIATDTERSYFHRALAELGGELSPTVLEPVTLDFRALMDEARTSQNYALIVAVLCVAEWVYLGWASRAKQPLPENFLYREWIELHDGEDFRAWVGFLRGELDRVGPGLGVEEQGRVLDFFQRATRLELRFFDMADAQ